MKRSMVYTTGIYEARPDNIFYTGARPDCFLKRYDGMKQHWLVDFPHHSRTGKLFVFCDIRDEYETIYCDTNLNISPKIKYEFIKSLFQMQLYDK